MTKAKAGFDLASIDTIEACNKPAEIEILHPVTQAPTGVFISVLGKDSDVYRSLIRELADARMKRQAQGKTDDPTMDKIESTNIDGLVAVTTAWRTGDKPTVTLGSEELEFTAANVRKVYERIIPVREQVAEAVNRLENFIPAS